MTDPTVSMRITARDDTAKGVGSAEKRVGAMAKRTAKLNRHAIGEFDRGISGSARTIVRTFGQVEQAMGRLTGSRSVTAGLGSRFSGLGSAASALGDGLAEASVAGEGLIGVVGTVGTAAAGAVAAVVGLAAGAWNIASGFAKAAVSIGNTASEIGVSTKALQQFNAAAGVVGVDEKTATGALGGLSQTLNDARYGRNTAALAVLQRLGIQLETNSDGTVNIEAMLPKIADALKRQNSSGRRTAARALGIQLDALPIFTQGADQLKADMKAADQGGLYTDDDIAKGRQQLRHDSDIGAWGTGKLARPGQRWLSGMVGDVEGGAVDYFDLGGRKSGVSGGGAGAGGIGAPRAGGAGKQRGRSPRVSSGSLSAKQSQAIEFFISKGWSQAQAAGIVANLTQESKLDPTAVGDSGKAFGVGQWHPDRQANFRKAMGKDIRGSSLIDQLEFVNWELNNTESAAGNRLKKARSAADAGSIISQFYERPRDRDLQSRARAGIADDLMSIPVHVTVDLKGAPSGTRTTVKAGKGKPAISSAVQP